MFVRVPLTWEVAATVGVNVPDTIKSIEELYEYIEYNMEYFNFVDNPDQFYVDASVEFDEQLFDYENQDNDDDLLCKLYEEE